MLSGLLHSSSTGTWERIADLMLRKGRPGKHTTGCCGLKDTVDGGRNKVHMQLAEEHKTRQVKVGPGGQA